MVRNIDRNTDRSQDTAKTYRHEQMKRTREENDSTNKKHDSPSAKSPISKAGDVHSESRAHNETSGLEHLQHT
jgi:hypothetical protein